MNITNDKVTEYINQYYSPIDEELKEFRERCEELEIPLILKETENYLLTFLKLIKPKKILEIGTAFGYSSLFFAKYLPECTITTLERSPYMYQNAEKNLAKYKEGERINMIVGDALENLDNLIEEAQSTEPFEPYDFVFIDAAKSHYKEFLEKSEKLCSKGAIILCDNILMRAYIVDRSLEPDRRHRTSVKRMLEFIDYINEREDLTVSLLSCGDGLAVIKLHD
ncbi:MAG: O-methyltransferase [Firmicutes bacterium]|nr:O-methyltransferase [Bacillota bacterium]